MKIVMTSSDFSDDYLEVCAQLGLDGLDTNRDHLIPGLKERGEADAKGLKDLARRLAAAGLPFYCVNLPHPLKYMSGAAGGDEELEALERTLLAYADAGIPIARVRVEPPIVLRTHDKVQSRGYGYRAFDHALWRRQGGPAPWLLGQSAELFWERGLRLYEALMPLAERSGIRLAMHPTDPPIAEAPFDDAGLDRLLSALPSASNGLLYCVGTRAEKAGQVGVESEIRKYGCERIFHVHLRNVRGNLRDTGGFDEVLLDDGDLNLFAILRALRSAGYKGAVNPDHLPTLGTRGRAESRSFEALCHAVGYLKGMIKALEC
jgi:mannonate dehydratase